MLSRALTSRSGLRLPLFWRVALTNGLILCAGVAALMFSPATVSSPVAIEEAGVLIGGALAVNLVSLLALRRAFEADRRESTARALRAQEAERTRVTSELHDVVGQTLTVLMLQLMYAARVAGPEAQERLNRAQDTAREALEDVRRIGQQLRPESLDDLGLPSALVTLADRVSGAAGVRIEAAVDDDLPELDQDETLAIFRVAQESLTNVVRHAHATSARVRLERSRDGVALSVRDDGRGAPPDSEPGGGLRGMRERALSVGGRLKLERPPSGGFEVRLELPRQKVHA